MARLSADVGAAKLKHEQKLLKCKSSGHLPTLNVKTLNRIGQLPNPTASAAKHNIDIVCVQKHRYHHSEVEIKYHNTGNGRMFVSASAWKKTLSMLSQGGVELLLSPRALKSLNSIERLQPRMMLATFNGNSSIKSINCYRPANASDQTDIIIFYNELSSFLLYLQTQCSNHQWRHKRSNR